MKRPSASPFLALFTCLGFLAGAVLAGAEVKPKPIEIKPAKPFTSGMVLQRGIPVPVWGTAAPGAQVTVTFLGQTKTASAGQDGKWMVKLDALTAGGPFVMTIGEKKLEDVLVGDVWVGSGQSNMDMTVTSYVANDPVLAKAVEGTYPTLRLLRKETGAAWQQATPENIKTFSALLFSFGWPLQKELDVPVGLMVGAVGGTPSGLWLSEDMYRSDSACQEEVKKFAATYPYEELKTKYDAALAEWQKAADEAKKAGQKPPGRPAVVAPAGECTSGKVGQLFESFIRPYVGYGIKGVLWDQGESRTAIVGVSQPTLMTALIKGWRSAWGQGDFPFLYVEKPSGGGPAWDYDSPLTNKANKFTPQPSALPGPPDKDYSYPVFLQIMKNPNTFMVTSTDLGPGTHPTNKSAYGARASTVALAAAYGRKVEIYGPLYAGHEIQANKVRIKFTHTGQGLAARQSDKLQGFEIAGEDKKFVWADAAIDGDTVVVSNPSIPSPVAVRYAWSSSFPWANLFNKDQLPAQPFRTDTW